MENIKNDTPPKHKEAMDSFIKKFLSDYKIVMDKFLMDPFNQERMRKLNNLSFVYLQTIERDAVKVFETGKVQYSDFVWNRFVLGSDDVVKTPINRNGLKLPKDIKKVLPVSPQIKLSPSVLTKLNDACEKRDDLALQLFDTEFTG